MRQNSDHIDDLPVAALTGGPISWIAPRADLTEVATALTMHEIGVLLVGEPGDIGGVISERDVVRAVAGGRDLRFTHAIEVATSHLVWCDADASIAEVALEMMERYVRHVLVEDDGELVGVVSARDLLGAYAAGPVDVE